MLTLQPNLQLDNQDYEKAAFYRDQVAKLEKAKKEAEENHTEDSATVTVKDMQRIVEERTNIPVGDLQKQEENQLRDLDKKLDEHVIGQTQAVDKVARAIRRNRIGLNKSGRPIGSFLFVGPTGVGKTAKVYYIDLTTNKQISLDNAIIKLGLSKSELMDSLVKTGYIENKNDKDLSHIFIISCHCFQAWASRPSIPQGSRPEYGLQLHNPGKEARTICHREYRLPHPVQRRWKANDRSHQNSQYFL